MGEILVIRERASPAQIAVMQEALQSYIKLAVDIRRGLLAGGGVMHADCEAALLEEGSYQEDIWGADWIPESRQVGFESLINIRPHQDNPSMEILDEILRSQVEVIARRLLEAL